VETAAETKHCVTHNLSPRIEIFLLIEGPHPVFTRRVIGFTMPLI